MCVYLNAFQICDEYISRILSRKELKDKKRLEQWFFSEVEWYFPLCASGIGWLTTDNFSNRARTLLLFPPPRGRLSTDAAIASASAAPVNQRPCTGKWRLRSRRRTVLIGAVLCGTRRQIITRRVGSHQVGVTTMAMSNLYSKISTKPMKRFQDNVAVKQTNAWVNGEKKQTDR